MLWQKHFLMELILLIQTHRHCLLMFAIFHLTFILIGENEVMLSDVVNLVRYLAENRVMDNLEVWPGLFHLWSQYGRNLKESNQAIRNIVRFINDQIK